MDNSSNDSPSVTWLIIEPEHLTISPGNSGIVKISVTNQGNVEDYFELSVRGIPPSWLSMRSLFLNLGAGEKQVVILNIQTPALPQSNAGSYPFTIRLDGKRNPVQVAEIEGVLNVAAQVLAGRIGLVVEQDRFILDPGETANGLVIVTNNSPTEDILHVQLIGIPASWISCPLSELHLWSGEKREVRYTLHPPRSAESLAGTHSFSMQIASQANAHEAAQVELSLTIQAYSHFNISLQPEEARANEPIQLLIGNLGNRQDAFTYEFLSSDEALVFHNPSEQVVRVAPGQETAVEFSATPRKRPLRGLFGLHTTFPYTVLVNSSEKETEDQHGKITSLSPVPIWVITAITLICLLMTCGAFFALLQLPVAPRVDTAATSAAFNKMIYASQTAIQSQIQAAETAARMETALAVATASLSLPTDTPIPPTLTPTYTPTNTATTTPLPPTFTPLPTITPFPTITPLIPSNTPVVFPIPNQGLIAYESNAGGPRDLFTFNTFDQSTIRLTFDAAIDTTPAWSPNGQWIAFASNRTGNFDIYLVQANGTGLINLTNYPGADDTDPTWSPNGLSIAFTSNRNGNQDIFTILTDGSGITDVTNNPAEDYHPDWTRNNQILFTSNRDANQEIYLMNSDGSSQVNLTNHPANDFLPASSRDSIQIAFVSNREGNQEIFTMLINGLNQTNVTRNPAEDTQPCWSGNGFWIAFVTNRTGNMEIFIVKNSGLDPFNLTNSPAQEQFPAWY